MKTIVCAALALAPVLAMDNAMKDMKIQKEREALEKGYLGRVASSVHSQPQECSDGLVTIDGEDFPCEGIDFLSLTSLTDMEIINTQGHKETGQSGADIWGWLSPTGREVTIMCQDNGVTFFDTSDPVNPCILGQLPSARRPQSWCDVKVYKDTAYIVKDARGGPNGNGDFPNETDIGGEVFDLLRLEDLSCTEPNDLPVYLENDFLWDFHGSSHNLAINTETGYLYSMGCDDCAGGLIIIDLNNDRLKPEYVTCIDGDGYTHDVQCVIYDGPDLRYTGREICFAFNEETVTIWDLTHKYSPSMLSRTGYPSQVYTHQGWLNGDMSLLLVDDELNELCSEDITAYAQCTDLAQNGVDGVLNTSTVVLDVSDLTAPVYTGTYHHPDISIDHNLYHWGSIHRKGWGGNSPMAYPPDERFMVLNNYIAGVKVMDVSSGNVDEFETVGYFDVAPDINELTFLGAWSGYMHPSGVYAVSSIDRGLFLLKPRMTFEQTEYNPLSEEGSEGEEDDAETDDEEYYQTIIFGLFAALVLTCMYACCPRRRAAPAGADAETAGVLVKGSL